MMAYGADVKTQRRVVTVPYLKEKKVKKEKIVFLTAYDYPTACIEDELGIDMILVGDSMGMTVFGYKGTTPVTLEQIIMHAEAVKRGAPHCFVVGDMPFMTYQVSVEQAVTNAGRLVKEAGVDGIKLEGGTDMAEHVRAITKAGIPVMGHIGLTPQSASALGGFKAQGKDVIGALKLIEDAKSLEEAGVFVLGLEAIPPEIAKIITETVNIPTLGIGAGPHVDGQQLIFHDAVGYYGGHVAKFVKQYANLQQVIKDALQQYIDEVHQEIFPGPEHCYTIDSGVLAEIKAELARI